MFTGLVEEVGEVLAITMGASSAKLKLKGQKVLVGNKIGDSISVNGVCLTVTETCHSFFMVDVMAETLRKSNLGRLNIGSRVNLERAMALGDRFGGHIVSGHIDGLGEIIKIQEEDIATWIKIKPSSELLKYIVMKGSIAIDGISLTVGSLEEQSFGVSLIPHTKGETTLIKRKKGELVNLECDVIAKYVERLAMPFQHLKKTENHINEDFLKEHGFI